VSVFRPSARVADPHGRTWEIYAFRVVLPDRPVGDSPLEYQGALLQAIGAFFWLTRGFLVLLVRLLVDVPAAAVRAARSDDWTIEAVSWAPYLRRYTWKTTREFRGQVLAQVEGGLARGEVPTPRNAQFMRAD
jgi:hypothetical protein